MGARRYCTLPSLGSAPDLLSCGVNSPHGREHLSGYHECLTLQVHYYRFPQFPDHALILAKQLGLFRLLGAWHLHHFQRCRVSSLVTDSCILGLGAEFKCSYIAIMTISARKVHKDRTRPQSRSAA